MLHIELSLYVLLLNKHLLKLTLAFEKCLIFWVSGEKLNNPCMGPSKSSAKQRFSTRKNVRLSKKLCGSNRKVNLSETILGAHHSPRLGLDLFFIP